jgi:hypothetical protein
VVGAKFLLTADFHLTARPIDGYRWDIFPWLKTQISNRGINILILAGDLADLKDNHSSAFVNRVVDELRELSHHAEIYIIPGNHDYTDPKNPYFRFLANLDFIHFFSRPKAVELFGVKTLFLPHTKRWRADWGLEPHREHILGGHDLIVLHQPFKGATTETGGTLEDGLAPKVFREERVGERCVVVAGDIHVPQTVGNVTYTGAPYPIHFGDSYQPRVLIYEDGKLTSIKRACLSKAMVSGEGPECLEGLTEGDMVRVKLQLPRSQFVDWQKRRQEIQERAAKMGLQLCGVEVKEKPVVERVRVKEEGGGVTTDRIELFRRFCQAKGIEGALMKQGMEVLK